MVQQHIIGVQYLLEIARSKCEAQTRQMLENMRQHAGSRFFERGANLVCDRTHYAAMMPVVPGSAQRQICLCASRR